MIKATHGALHVRANVRKLAKCCSVHFDARREFASRSGASHHYYDGPIRHHGRVPLEGIAQILHSLPHRAQRNLGTSVCAFDHSTQSQQPRAQPKRLRRLPPKAQQNIGATLGSPQICKRSPRGLGFTAMRSKMHSLTCRQAFGEVSLTSLLRRPLHPGMNV